MHLVKHIGRLLMLVTIAALTPLAAAAAAVDVIPQFGPAPIWAAVGLAGLGAVIHLKIGKRSVTLDAEDPASAHKYDEALEEHVETEKEAALAPVSEELTAAQEEGAALRSILVGEILRIRKLTAGEDFDVEDERKYLDGLPAERLKMEFDRLPKREDIKLKAVTKNEQPADQDDPVAALDPDAQ